MGSEWDATSIGGDRNLRSVLGTGFSFSQRSSSCRLKTVSKPTLAGVGSSNVFTCQRLFSNVQMRDFECGLVVFAMSGRCLLYPQSSTNLLAATNEAMGHKRTHCRCRSFCGSASGFENEPRSDGRADDLVGHLGTHEVIESLAGTMARYQIVGIDLL